ncbi:MAG TPA: hypothetical protein GX734_05810 [Clostridiaceae bacterium]|nr:hypothetical protein [Clostridiaceae bacterium]
MAKAKNKKKRASSSHSSSKSKTNRSSRSGLTPKERQLGKRFLTSKIGRWVIAFFVVLLLLTFNALIAGRRVDLFFMLTGIELLIAIIAFWFFLLLGRSSKKV